MSDYKEFTGKSLDDAIQNACSHFSLERSKLEIEIVSGGSSGIFGLMGKKKARVKARPRATVTLDTGREAVREKMRKTTRPAKPARKQETEKREKPEPREAAPEQAESGETSGKNEQRADGRKKDTRRPKRKENRKPRPPRNDNRGNRDEQKTRAEQPAPAAAPEQPFPLPTDPQMMDEDDEFAVAPGNEIPEEEIFEEPLNEPELEKIIIEALQIMIRPIVGEAPIRVVRTRDRVKAVIDDDEQAGLLIGREGQTLNALQYLLNRVVAKKWEEPVKLQIDTGQYRERQDDKLRQMAFYLADRAKSLGRPQSTKPLSSYHRRVVHLALQNDTTVSTRSKGDGPLKRVLIMPRRERGQARA